MRKGSERDISKIFENGKLIDHALRKAAREAWRQHKRLGLPLVIWENERARWISPNKIRP